MSLGLYNFSQEFFWLSYLCFSVSFSFGCLQKFPCVSTFDYDVPWCSFLYISFAWVLLRFLNLLFIVFIKFGKILAIISFFPPSVSPFFWKPSYMFITLLDMFHTSLIYSVSFFQTFFSLYSILKTFHCYVITFTSISFCYI